MATTKTVSKTYFVDVVEIGSFFGPVPVTHRDTILRQFGQHDDDHATLLPHHLQWNRHRDS